MYISLFIILFCLFIIYYFRNNSENFQAYMNKTNPGYLVPTKDKFCYDIGLKPAFSPSICTTGEGINTQFDYYRNCRCTDENNNCKICYPTIQWSKYN